ncbi:MAG: aminotransferase class V-fold PLP-dependent enzyme [Holophagaceae bacterium]|nr:aminotransferase class V-fold PLP-dependent enzyme [Holophagaceae bacterium]
MATPLNPSSFLEERFLAEYAMYAQTRHLDAARAKDYARLDENHQVYLDYSGSGLYAESQLQGHLSYLSHHVLGNPHSLSPASRLTSQDLEEARREVLDFFRADPVDYTVIFTSNASGALKLVGESYPFQAGGRLLLSSDNHNSMNGIREFAKRKGCETTYAPLTLPEMRLDEGALEFALASSHNGAPRLFGYPARSNFSGVLHSPEWIALAHGYGWDVLLDAAAFVPSHRLEVSHWKPDFVSISFYKMFGYPTGVGCLLAQREALSKLRRPWFAGGTVTAASVQGDRHYFAEGEQAFEDGTVNFLDLPAVTQGLRYLDSLGLESIGVRGLCLTGWMLEQMQQLKHQNGLPAVRIYGPSDTNQRGATITFNLLDPQGNLVDHREVMLRAESLRISLRTGCFCNPGSGETALGLGKEELEDCFSLPEHEHHFNPEDFLHCIEGKGSGAVRISFGLASNFEDARCFLALLEDFCPSLRDGFSSSVFSNPEAQRLHS